MALQRSRRITPSIRSLPPSNPVRIIAVVVLPAARIIADVPPCFTSALAVAGSAVPYWNYYGSTVVTNTRILLTPDRQSRSGILFNTEPCMLHNWQVIIDFKISGSGAKTFGDGMAFFYIKDNLDKLGGAGPVFGAPDRFTGLGVFIDTFDNNGDRKNPLIQAMLGDGKLAYDRADGALSRLEAAQCSADVRGLAHSSKMRVRYEMGTLTVSVDLKGRDTFEDCFVVEDLDLPLGYSFALGAMTGGVADVHEVASLYTTNLGGVNPMHEGVPQSRLPAVKGAAVSDSPAAYEKKTQKLVTSDRSSWLFTTVVVMCVLVGVVVLGVVILAQTRNAKRRF